MNKVGVILINASVALYLFSIGIMGFIKERSLFSDGGGEIGTMIRTIFGKGDFSDVLVVVLSIIAIIAGVLVLLSLLKVEIPFMDLILVIFICVWAAFILIIDIINPISEKDSLFRKNTWDYLRQLASHLLVLGALITSTKRFGA